MLSVGQRVTFPINRRGKPFAAGTGKIMARHKGTAVGDEAWDPADPKRPAPTKDAHGFYMCEQDSDRGQALRVFAHESEVVPVG